MGFALRQMGSVPVPRERIRLWGVPEGCRPRIEIDQFGLCPARIIENATQPWRGTC